MMVTEKSRETRLRRIAERQGLRLVKSRRRDERATDFGEYYIVDPNTNALVAGDYHSLPDLDAVEAWLTENDYFAELDDPQGLEVGGVASPGDLAYPLAYALVAFDRKGLQRPRYTVRVRAGDDERGLTDAERVAFDAALKQALDRVEGMR